MSRTLNLNLSIVAGSYSVCRMQPDQGIPEWATRSLWFSVTKTLEELSVVCMSENVPSSVQGEPGWALIKVEGPLDFSLTGILARLSGGLAEGAVSLFAISTFDTDYLLVKHADLDAATRLLERVGCTFSN